MTKRVAVLKGGWSEEREVSLVSGRECARALRAAGYDVREIDVTSDLKKFLNDLSPLPDVVFNALHGKGGEDGCVQGILDVLGVPYTHSGRLASAIAMDKARTKDLVRPRGMPVADGLIVKIADLAKGRDPIERPYVVKPNAEGSSVGVFIVKTGDNRNIAAEWKYGDEALVEKYIPGRELSVGVMGGEDGRPRALTVTEIIPSEEFYSYEAKYADGGSRHVVPAQIPPAVFDEAKRLAVLAHEALGCDGVSRSDFRWDDSKPGASGLCFLEINTQPGMTPTSLVPEQAQSVGIAFEKLVSWIVENARRHEERGEEEIGVKVA